jgi:hypothetical protein
LFFGVGIVSCDVNIPFVKADRTVKIFIFFPVREADEDAFFSGDSIVSGDDGDLFSLSGKDVL